jgi:6-phosphogluconolactonase/glucosamine-6-phosphate isomerase/deaminase
MFFVFNDDCYVKKRKKVSFCSLVNVILIPSRLDYYTFLDELWWRESDYTSFYTSANQEILDLVKKHPNITLKNAKKILYQPSDVPNETVCIEMND